MPHRVMPQFNPYMLTSLLSAMIILAMGVCLFTVSMPHEPELKAYRFSRGLLGIAYIFLGAIHLAGIFIDDFIHASFIVAPVQALLFTFALIALINNGFVTRRRLSVQLLLIFAIAAVSLVNRYMMPRTFASIDHAIQAGYFCLYIYYVWIFFREYRNYRKRADDFYSGDERKRLRWVAEVFVMVSVVGLFAGILTDNDVLFLIFIGGYTILYTYLAIRYINYVELFHRMAPIVSAPAARERSEEHVNGKIADDALAGWVERKEFLHSDLTLETLAGELHTTPSWLSRRINSTCGQNFRSWIASMRIGEAKHLIETHPDMTMEEIQERSGIASRSTFFRQFRSFVGISPAEYRGKVNGRN